MDTVLENTTEDTEMADCDEEKVVTMMDVLKEQEDFEEDADAVLGASDDKNCTYSKGYIKRQAIYACLTCCSEARDDPDKRAGVCLACSLTCHENHELIELYTKRNFKCDCGNPKFNSHPCQFTPSKTDLNEDNVYNQNFSGIYCVCQRPYPDPESKAEDEMIQCIICEDWLHASHLEAIVPDNDQYSEMICKGCMEKNNFLHDYSNFAVNTENILADPVPNGFVDESNKICNGEVKDKTNHDNSNEDGSLKENVDVEMTDENIDDQNISENDQHKIIKPNEVENSEDISDTKEFSDEAEDKNKAESIDIDQKRDEAESNTLIDTDESNQLDSNNDTELDAPVTEESSDKCADNENKTPGTLGENESDILSSSTKENIEHQNDSSTKDENITETALDKESSDQQNDNKGSAPDNEESTNENKIIDQKNEPSNLESEKAEIVEKSAEQIEEDRLLADPTDDIKKENVQISESLPKETDKSNANAVTANSDTTMETNAENEASNFENHSTSSIDTHKEPNIEDTLVETTNSNTEEKLEEIKTDIEMENANLDKIDESKTESEENTVEATTGEADDEVCTNRKTDLTSKETGSEKRKLSTEENTDADVKKPKLVKSTHELCSRPKGIPRIYKGATFWPSTFRQKLCTCTECITMYKDLSVLFLIDPEDTVTAYENLGKEKINGTSTSQYEKGLQALSSLDRIQQINALTEYNKMRDKLLDFLKSFKDRKEVVKEEDIKAFFAEIKPKREPDGVYFCR